MPRPKRPKTSEAETASARELAKAAQAHLDEVPAASEKLFPGESVRLETSPSIDLANEKKKQTLDQKARDADAKYLREKLAREHEFFERRVLFVLGVTAFCFLSLSCMAVAIFSKDGDSRSWSREIIKAFATGIGAFILGRLTAGKKIE